MAGIYSQGGSAGHRYAGWLSEVEAKNFTFGGKVFNGSPSAIYVGSNLVWAASPYSVEATEVLKATFPTQWAIINDYGLAHPEIVPYMNAYATEDPKIAYSLVEGIGTRWIQGDSNAYILTDIIPTNATTSYIKFSCQSSIRSVQWAFGSENSNSGPRFGAWMNSNCTQLNIRFGGNGVTSGVMITLSGYSEGQVIEIERKSDGTVYVDGVSKGTPIYTTAFIYPFTIFGMNYNGVTNDPGPMNGKIYECMLDGHRFVPFIRNNQYGMLDLTTGTWKGNANSSGSFTISETPSTP